MSALLADLVFSWRLLRKQPVFAGAMILTLALGIGVNTAISSVVRSILVAPWPYDDPAELIALRGRFPTQPTTWVAYREVEAWQERTRAFETIALHANMAYTVERDGQAQREIGIPASANLFEMLGVTPHLGRTFTAEEDQAGDALVVLSYPYWQRLFGGEDVLGQVLRIEDEPFEIIGVMGPDVLYPGDFRRTAFWIPIGYDATDEWGWNYETHPGLSATGRLADRVDLAAARQDMARITAELAAERPDTHQERAVRAYPVLERSFGALRPRVLALAAAVHLVLLITCVNVASLLLVRDAGRGHELAVRRALGASRARLMRQLLVESVSLALVAAAVGLGFAWATLLGLRRVADIESMPAFRDLTLDGQILLMTAFVAVVTGIAFGLAPALAGLHGENAEALHGAVKGSPGRRGGRLLGGLVVTEIGLALVVLICAVLSVKSFYHIVYDNPGFAPDDLFTFSFSLPEDAYPGPEEQAAFFDVMLERLNALPDVESATTTVPIVAYWSATFDVVGRAADERGLAADAFQVSPGFFATLGVKVLEGRGFTAADRAGAPRVVVVDERFADSFFPGEAALGQRIRLSGDDPGSPGAEIVGVVARAAYDGVHRGSGPTFFEPMPQSQKSWGWAVVRTSGDPTRLVETMRRSVRELDPRVVLDELWTMDHRLAIHRGPQRLAAALLAAFAALALLLATIGIYAVVAYSVTARHREIGIRMALGAESGQVLRLVLGRSIGLTAAGIVLGWLLAAGAVKLLASQLYATEPYELALWIGLTLLIATGSVAACLPPALRASRVQPATVLHRE